MHSRTPAKATTYSHSRFSAALLASSLILSLPALAANWPQWRGPLGTGITEETHLPTSWGPEKHVHWKVSLPEKGNSTPILWNDRVFHTVRRR